MQKILGDVIQSISANGVLRYLFDTGVTISVTVVFLLLIRPFMKKMPRKGMYILWLMVAVRILCPVSIGGIYDMMPEQLGSKVSQTNQDIKIERIASRFASPQEEAADSASEALYHTPAHKPQDYQSTMPVSTIYETGTEQEVFTQSDPEKAFSVEIGVDMWLLLIWGLGAFGLILFMIISMIRNHRRFSDARHLYDNVYVHPLVDNSFVQGIFSPRIYISEKVSEQDRAYILCHERKHIKRRDYIVKPFMFLLLSVYWFNPFMWIAYHFMMKDMEVSCDEAVIRELGEEARAEYSYLLVSMATGRRGILNQNAAFSVGVVKDRIVSVMKYRKPTVLTSVVLVIAVVLCSCSIASTPGRASVPVTPTEKEGVYREQSFFPYRNAMPGTDRADAVVYPSQPQMDAKGNIVTFAEVNEGEKWSLQKCVWEEERWKEENTAWQGELEKMFSGKPMRMGHFCYSSEGYLYINVYDDIYTEKVFADGEEEKAVDSFLEKRLGRGDYETNCYLILKIDEKQGTIETIQLPIDAEYAGSGFAHSINEFSVLGDGSILVTYGYLKDDEKMTCLYDVYSPATGEKLISEKEVGAADTPVAGDDFIVFGVNNQQTGLVEIHVCDVASGEKEYSLETSVAYQNQTDTIWGQNFAIGVKGDTIVMATREGIFEAEYGEDEFKKVIDGDAKEVYYLSERKYNFSSKVYKGEDGSYMLYRNNSKFSETEEVLCYYRKG